MRVVLPSIDYMIAKPTIRRDGDRIDAELCLGTTQGERTLSLVQFLVMCAGLPIAIPDFQMMRFDDGFEIVGSIAGFAFCIVWVAVGLFASTRFLYAPYPILISFTPNELAYDSGRPGLNYLCETYGEYPSPIIAGVFQRRRKWSVRRTDISATKNPARITDTGIVVSGRDQNNEFTIRLPASTRDTFLAAIESWIMAEPRNAPESAVGRLLPSEITPPTG